MPRRACCWGTKKICKVFQTWHRIPWRVGSFPMWLILFLTLEASLPGLASILGCTSLPGISFLAIWSSFVPQPVMWSRKWMGFAFRNSPSTCVIESASSASSLLPQCLSSFLPLLPSSWNLLRISVIVAWMLAWSLSYDKISSRISVWILLVAAIIYKIELSIQRIVRLPINSKP